MNSLGAVTSNLFHQFLDDLCISLSDRYIQKYFLDSDVDGNKFEKVVFEAIQGLLSNKLKAYSSWVPTLVSGKKFPDIVLQISSDEKFGIEVKTSKGCDWKTLGGSIMESTRVDGVTDISVLFAKLNPFLVRHKPFELCVSDVAVTHSPRYLIDLDIAIDKTIFKRINVAYDDVWKSEKPFEKFRQYFKDKATREKTGLWWIEDDSSRNADELPKLEIQFFSKLPKEKKDYLINKSMILFPNIFSDVADYDEVSIWLVNMGILNNSLRDTYSAGSNVVVLGFTVPSKFKRLNDRLPDIQNLFKKIKNDFSLQEKFKSDVALDAYDLWVKEIKMSSPSEYLPFLEAMFNLNKFI